jgi:hypothetical protein
MVVSQTELWQFTGTSWLRMNSDHVPEVGLDQVAAFDQASGELIIYYGSAAGATWRCRRTD